MILLGSLVQVMGFGFTLVSVEEAVDGIEPGGRCRSEVEYESGMLFDPFEDFGMLVSGIVVDNDVDRFLLGHFCIDDVEEADELLMTMTLHTLADDLAFKHIERGEQRGNAVTLVVVGHGASASLFHRQPRLGAVQRLDLTFLIDPEHDGVVGRIDVQPDDLLELGRELRIVGKSEPAHQMRPQPMSAPDPLHRTDADASGLRHRRARPMAAGRWRSRQRQGHHPFGHLKAQRRNARGACLVAPKPRRALVVEPFLPAPDHGLGFAGVAHDFGSATTIGRHKHNLCPPAVLLPAVAVSHYRLKRAAVDRTQLNVCSLVHSSNSHTRVRQGIPERIELSDLVH